MENRALESRRWRVFSQLDSREDINSTEKGMLPAKKEIKSKINFGIKRLQGVSTNQNFGTKRKTQGEAAGGDFNQDFSF